LEKNEQVKTAIGYKCAINSFTSFAGDMVLYKDITVSWLKAYEKHMMAQGKSATTIGVYLRNLRTIFNEAIKIGYIEASLYPFGLSKDGRYEIPEGAGRKMALSLAQVKQIFEYDDGNEATQQYVDLWRFSYLCNGANMNDILHLKYGSIQGEELFFLRGKTSRTSKKKREVVAFITPEMQHIMDRWGSKNKLPDGYIFPYLNKADTEQKKKAIIADVIKRINKRTKRISAALNLPCITTYTARHSYATVLKRSGANIAFISESLGHSDLKTTESYLASFETEERKKNALLLTQF
jgi:integrase